MSAVRTNAAAAMLGISPNTLRSWERRFGYPSPRRTAGGHRQYDLGEIEALRQAFSETHNVSSAIAVARERGCGPASPSRLGEALLRFDEVEADRILEESLAVRSLERTVEEVLLPSIDALASEDEDAVPTAELGFAWRWATGWLAAVRRAAPAATREQSVVIFDASRPSHPDALYIQALELCLRRGGLRTLSLTADLDPTRIGHALRATSPSAIVLAGRGLELDALGRLVYQARRTCEGLEVLDFRSALPDTGMSTVERLGTSPIAARDSIIERFDGLVAPPRFSHEDVGEKHVRAV